VTDAELDIVLAWLREDPAAEVPFTDDALRRAIIRWLLRTYQDTPLLQALDHAREHAPPDFALLRDAHARACAARLWRDAN
jgi:hypothetical protein